MQQNTECYIGKKFGFLEVIYLDFRKASHSFWKCRCQCGREKTISQCSLRRGFTRSCGCLKSIKKNILLSTAKDRLKANIVIENTCWIWKRGKDKDGYGTCGLGYGDQRAHRASYKAFIGDIPKGIFVCHHCDNPSCINPDHLFLGTNKDNILDARNKGRLCCEKDDRKASLGEKNRNSKLNNKDIIHIRSLTKKGFSSRHLSESYKVHHTQIQRINRGESWSHI